MFGDEIVVVVANKSTNEMNETEQKYHPTNETRYQQHEQQQALAQAPTTSTYFFRVRFICWRVRE